MRPFLRWAGGKQRVARRLLDYTVDFEGTYREPFCGAASLFFRVAPEKAALSDGNEPLVRTLNAVRTSPQRVSEELRSLGDEADEEVYYQLRERFNADTLESEAAFAAAFIYLNHTSFNGIWRVNRSGQYNVPFGRRNRFLMPSEEDLCSASRTLEPARIFHADYETALGEAEKGDFVYLDPPYLSEGDTPTFDRFTAARFTPEQHESVATWAQKLWQRGTFVMVSNADVPRVRELYEGFSFHEISVHRSVSGNGDRSSVAEVVITNFDAETGALREAP